MRERPELMGEWKTLEAASPNPGLCADAATIFRICSAINHSTPSSRFLDASHTFSSPSLHPLYNPVLRFALSFTPCPLTTTNLVSPRIRPERVPFLPFSEFPTNPTSAHHPSSRPRWPTLASLTRRPSSRSLIRLRPMQTARRIPQQPQSCARRRSQT
jgi:hypothetical protein